VSFAAITLCVSSQRGFIVVSVYFVIDSAQKLLDTPSYVIFKEEWLDVLQVGVSICFPSKCMLCNFTYLIGLDICLLLIELMYRMPFLIKLNSFTSINLI